MEIILHNYSPYLNTDALTQIVKFVLPKNLPESIIVEFTDLWFDYNENDERVYGENVEWDGTAYFPNKVVITVSKDIKFPLNWWVNEDLPGKYIRGILLNNLEEFLVYCAAHELRHLEQWFFKKLKPLYQDFKGDDETDSDLYAILKLNEWRLKFGY